MLVKCLQATWKLDKVAIQVMQASFGGQVKSLYNQQLAFSVSIPADACSPLSNGVSVSGSVAIIQRGNCTMSSKVCLHHSRTMSDLQSL